MKKLIEKWTDTSWLYSMAHDDTDSSKRTNNRVDIKAVKQTNNKTNDEAVENALAAVFVCGLVILGFLFGIMDSASRTSTEKEFRRACYAHNHGYRYSRPKH